MTWSTHQMRLQIATFAGHLVVVLCVLFLCFALPAKAESIAPAFGDTTLEKQLPAPKHLSALCPTPEIQPTASSRGNRGFFHLPCILWENAAQEFSRKPDVFQTLRPVPLVRLKLPACRGLIVFSLPPPLLTA